MNVRYSPTTEFNLLIKGNITNNRSEQGISKLTRFYNSNSSHVISLENHENVKSSAMNYLTEFVSKCNAFN